MSWSSSWAATTSPVVRPRDTEGTAAGHYDGQSCLSFKSQSQYPLENTRLADKTEDGYRCASVSNKTNMA